MIRLKRFWLACNALCRCRFSAGFGLGIGSTDQNRKMTVILGFVIGKRLFDYAGFASVLPRYWRGCQTQTDIERCLHGKVPELGNSSRLKFSSSFRQLNLESSGGS